MYVTPPATGAFSCAEEAHGLEPRGAMVAFSVWGRRKGGSPEYQATFPQDSAVRYSGTLPFRRPQTENATIAREASGDGSTCCARPVFNVSNTRQCVLSCCINLYRYDRVHPTTYAALPPVSRKEGTDTMNINAQQVSFRRQARRTNPRR